MPAGDAKRKRKVESATARAEKRLEAVRDPSLMKEMAAELAKAGGGDAAGRVLGKDGGGGIDIRGVISTQCPTVDAAIGRGGIPLGRLSILHGKEASGKTTLALHAVAECQRMGGVVVYIDKEYKLDPTYASQIGVDFQNQFILSQPEHLEGVFAVMNGATKIAARLRTATGIRVPVLVVLDSMNACLPKEDVGDEDDEDDDWESEVRIAGPQRIWSRRLPKLIPRVSREDVALLCISQVRAKIGVLFGNKEEIAGGNAPKFHAALIMEVRRTGTLKVGGSGKKGKDDDSTAVGSISEVYVRKNGISAPFKRAEFNIMYGKGIDFQMALLARAMDFGIIAKTGAWYAFGDTRLGQGAGKTADRIREDVELQKLLQEAVLREERWGGGGKGPAAAHATITLPKDDYVVIEEPDEAPRSKEDKTAALREKMKGRAKKKASAA